MRWQKLPRAPRQQVKSEQQQPDYRRLRELAEQHERARADFVARSATAARPGQMKRSDFDRLSAADKMATVHNGVSIVD